MEAFQKLKRRLILGHLRRQKADDLVRRGEKYVIPCFQTAARKMPAYRSLLQDRGLDPSTVKDIRAFKEKVPVIDKSIFAAHPLHELCVDFDVDKIQTVILSSGFSGNFSYSAITGRELKWQSFSVDLLLDLVFNISKKRTFFISALGQGVKVYTGVPLAETSVRSDSVAALIKKVGPYYDQILITSSAFFMKKIIEDGVDRGVDWKSLPVSVFFGEDWIPESYRTYLGGILGVDFDDPLGKWVGCSFGVSELGLSLFQESPETIRIKRLAQKDRRLHAALFGEGSTITPSFFYYHPSLIFVESLAGELVFTTLDKRAMSPLIRYAPGDLGRVHPYAEVKDILTRLGYADHVPKLQNPMVSVLGRKGKDVLVNGVRATPEAVKEGLYRDLETARATTGYFRMSGRNDRLEIEIQLRETFSPTEELKKKYIDGIARFVHVDFDVTLHPYARFPYGMSLNYENKFQYV